MSGFLPLSNLRAGPVGLEAQLWHQLVRALEQVFMSLSLCSFCKMGQLSAGKRIIKVTHLRGASNKYSALLWAEAPGGSWSAYVSPSLTSLLVLWAPLFLRWARGPDAGFWQVCGTWASLWSDCLLSATHFLPLSSVQFPRAVPLASQGLTAGSFACRLWS